MYNLHSYHVFANTKIIFYLVGVAYHIIDTTDCDRPSLVSYQYYLIIVTSTWITEI